MEADEHSRTEDATPFKLDQARKKGMVARSAELSILAATASMAGFLWAFGENYGREIAIVAQRALIQTSQLAGGQVELWSWINRLLQDVMAASFPMVATIALAVLLSVLVQTGFLFAPSALKPDFSKINPLTGLKRVFSLQTLIDAFKSSLKLLIYTTIALLVVRPAMAGRALTLADPRELLHLIYGYGLKLLMWLVVAAAVFAALDQLIVRRQFARKMRMSKRDLRDEMRHREGEPRMKQRRKQLHQELLKRAKSMRSVRTADVLITNPTHFAVALKYDSNHMSAPAVVAKGAGDFAARLKKIAFIYGIPTIEDPQLARQLFYKTGVDREVPEIVFKQVAGLYLRLRQRRARNVGETSTVTV
jgi:flagellar biosynthetic protein FlhB